MSACRPSIPVSGFQPVKAARKADPVAAGAAVTLFIMLSVPSSGLTVPVDLLRGFFRFLHPVLPMGNAADALRDVDYFDDRQLGRPTAVLCAWIAAGAALIVLGYVKQLRRLVREARAGMAENVPVPPAEDPTVELPEPVALPRASTISACNRRY
ncbi:DUF3533 domain-containing protein [Actinoallomurus sp. NPDC052308]|uniref:DUF3533 domain-containing protein n=1 Tax=Actinoallomurus sp. NPDC052308 TaxID=3155530 RepID=UPI0034306F3F